MNEILTLADEAIATIESIKELDEKGEIFTLSALTAFCFYWEKRCDWFDANKFINEFSEMEGDL